MSNPDLNVMSVLLQATAGDTHLGGEDMDQKLVEYFSDEFRRKHGKDISGNQKALTRLRTACERAKRALSNSPATSLEVDALADGIDFHTQLSQVRGLGLSV